MQIDIVMVDVGLVQSFGYVRRYQMTRGGTRPNAGRPKLPEHIRKHKVNFWITLAEKEMIKRFIKRIREEM